MALKIEEQIEVLKAAKDVYKRGRYSGLCRCIATSLNQLGFVNSNDFDDIIGGDDSVHELIRKNIPSFNYTALTRAGKNGLSPETNKIKKNAHRTFWWYCGDESIRPKVVDYLISELEKKL